MAVVLGPVLGFRGATAKEWRTSALVATDDDVAPTVSVQTRGASGASVPTSSTFALARSGAKHAWRIDWTVARPTEADLTVEYAIDGGAKHHYVVPPQRAAKLRLAYASCNGFSDPKDMKQVVDKNERWKHLASVHATTPQHLLLLGGDQVYADSIFRGDVPALAGWPERSWEDRTKRTLPSDLPSTLGEDVARFYFDLYCNRWSQPEPAALLASIPTLMMWDDHDIFDGWGSYPDELQASGVFQLIFEKAVRAFRVFQLQSPMDAAPSFCFPGQAGMSYAHRIDDLSIVALDLRSERSRTQIAAPNSWDVALAKIDELAKDAKHLLVLSSIPVVYPPARLAEGLLDLVPGVQEPEDDLKDQWTSRPHRIERVRLVHRLLAAAARESCRVTLLSGDVHVAALGAIVASREAVPANANVINQLVSSPIVHVPAPRAVRAYLRLRGRFREALDRGIEARMLEFPATDQRILGARNWLALTLDEQRRLWAEWWLEGADDHAYAKAIHPCGDVPEA